MRFLAALLLTYTIGMLLIHVSTTKLLKAWGGPTESWIKMQFSPQRALRVEALYWACSLAGWVFWPSFAWKLMVVVFASIHLGIWLASELHAIPLNIGNVPSAQTSKTHRMIIAFDLVEAVALVAMAWLALSYALHPEQHLLAQHVAQLAFPHACFHLFALLH